MEFDGGDFDDLITSRRLRSYEHLLHPDSAATESPSELCEPVPLDDLLVATRPLTLWLDLWLSSTDQIEHLVLLDPGQIDDLRRETDGSLSYLLHRGLRQLLEYLKAHYPYGEHDDEALRQHPAFALWRRVYVDHGDYGATLRIDPDLLDEIYRYADEAVTDLVGVAHLIRWGLDLLLKQHEGYALLPEQLPAIPGSTSRPIIPFADPWPHRALDPISHADFRNSFGRWLEDAT